VVEPGDCPGAWRSTRFHIRSRLGYGFYIAITLVGSKPFHLNHSTMSVHALSQVAILMRREAVQGAMARWQSHRWTLADVVPHEPGFGPEPRCLRHTPDESLWIYPDWPLELYTDDAEGYWLNQTAPVPSFFVMWRMQESVQGQEPVAVPQALSLSYHDAGRWLDAQETVENVPAPADVVAHCVLLLKRFMSPRSRNASARKVSRG